MIRRETDAELINRISELPEVRPFICYHEDPIDWTPAIEACVILSNGEDACAVFEPTPLGLISKDVFQVHTIFGPSCRGRKALDTARNMLIWMYDKEGAQMIWGATPVKNKAALLFNRMMGGEPLGRDEYDAEGEVELFKVGRPT